MFRHILWVSIDATLLGKGVKESILFVLLSMIATMWHCIIMIMPDLSWNVVSQTLLLLGEAVFDPSYESLVCSLCPCGWCGLASGCVMQAGNVFSGDAVTTTLLASHHPLGSDIRQCLDSIRERAGGDWSGLRPVNRVWPISGNLLLSEIVNHQTVACLGAVFRWMNVQYLN